MTDDTEQRAIVQVLLGLYRRGWFPMGRAGSDDVHVYDPDPRAIIPLDGRFHVPRSLAQRVRSRRFVIRSDSAFEDVVRACAARRNEEDGTPETWITDEILRWYVALHRAGHAHSVEAWRVGHDGVERLVGGLYGVRVGGLFAGESMFSRPDLGGTDASKVCLVHLVGHLRARGFRLLDTQFQTEHLARFGAVEIPRSRYRALLRGALAIGGAAPCEGAWLPWDVEEQVRAGLA